MSKKEIIQALCLTLVPFVIAVAAILGGSGALNYAAESSREGIYVVGGLLCYVVGALGAYAVIKSNLPKKDE